MARVRMVTRTVEVNTFTVMTCNTETAEVQNIDFTMGAIPDNADVMKLLKKQYESETLKLCAIVNQKSETLLYGMTEEKFIELATVMPPRSATINE